MHTDKEQVTIHYEERNVATVISDTLYHWSFPMNKPIVVLCIGTDRSTGDSLGPFIGTYLTEKYKLENLIVYGTLNEPVHAKNLSTILEEVNRKHNNALVLAIDACLGRSSSVGHILCGKGKLKPGSAFNKVLPPVGDFYLAGIVNVAGFMEYSILQSTRLSLVTNMAKQIAKSLFLLDYKFSATPVYRVDH